MLGISATLKCHCVIHNDRPLSFAELSRDVTHRVIFLYTHVQVEYRNGGQHESRMSEETFAVIPRVHLSSSRL